MTMVGHIHDRFPRLELILEGIEETLAVDFIVDTGFDGEIAIPASILRRLRYQNGERRDIRLADGTEDRCFTCEIAVEWNGEQRQVTAFLLNGQPLLGIEMLEGFSMCIEVISDGEVTIEEI